VRREVRSEAGTISLSDPIITLTLVTVAPWLAVFGWSLQRKEQANGAGRPAASPTSGIKAEVEINPGKCARFAFCEHEAPEIFKLNGDRIDYKTMVPADQIDAVAMAVKVCPARAIKMKVPGTKPLSR
jgi:sulfoxide reductase heme-binding subunit YedZ